MKVSIIGLGLIGGSIGARLLESGWADEVVGIDNNLSNLEEAKNLGLISRKGETNYDLKDSDILIIAIPVNNIAGILPQILNSIGENTIALDMGSTKGNICQSVEGHPNRGAFVATHPIAGTENSGPSAAFSSLFMGKTGIICDGHKSTSTARARAFEVYKVLGMKVIEMESSAHDMHIAYVSHLSHISSFVLGQTVLEIEKDEKSIFDMAGSGFASTVRLAKSSPEMWASIFTENKNHISKSLDVYIENLLKFKSFIDDSNTQVLFDTMKKTNEIRRVLDGIDINHLTPKKDQKKLEFEKQN